jgi:FixJ family two-component response regulator
VSDAAAPDQTVFVVDDDEAVRDALGMLLRAAGLRVQSFDSALAILRELRPERPGCLILDIRMPGMSGLELQDELRKRRCRIPIIFLTGHGDIPMAVRALKHGAMDFIEKPHDERRLVLATFHALRLDAEQRSAGSRNPHAPPELAQRLALLSAREREVLDHVLLGRPTRVIAQLLCVSGKTIEFHRARIRERLGVGSLAELFGLFLPFAGQVETGESGSVGDSKNRTMEPFDDSVPSSGIVPDRRHPC